MNLFVLKNHEGVILHVLAEASIVRIVFVPPIIADVSLVDLSSPSGILLLATSKGVIGVSRSSGET